MDIHNEQKLAVLIDAENVSYGWVKPIMAEIARYGNPTIKRIYTDWTQPAAGGWKNVLLEYAITPIQQYRYTSGKNSSDSAMIIDAMDLLYSQKVDGFVIVSSDSDFTRLAQRLREAGMRVIGIGAKKTPVPFKASCERFIYIENLKEGNGEPPVAVVAPAAPAAAPASASVAANQQAHPPKSGNGKAAQNAQAVQAAQAAAAAAAAIVAAATAPDPQDDESFTVDKLTKILQTTIADVAEESGWASLSDVGSLLAKKMPDFDTRNYGHRTLTPLIESLSAFEVDKRQTGRPNIWHVYIKNK